MTPSNFGSGGGSTTWPRGAAASGDFLTTGCPSPFVLPFEVPPLLLLFAMRSKVGTASLGAEPADGVSVHVAGAPR